MPSMSLDNYSHGQKFKITFSSKVFLSVTITNTTALSLLPFRLLKSTFRAESNFDVIFWTSLPLCYDITMKSTEILGNHSGSADKECDRKIMLLGLTLHQSMHNSFLIFVCKLSKLHEKYCLRKGSGEPSVNMSYGSRPTLEKRDKDSVLMM